MNFTRQEKGEDSYMIPNGGASMLGKWGYFDAFEEILNQVISIVCITSYSISSNCSTIDQSINTDAAIHSF